MNLMNELAMTTQLNSIDKQKIIVPNRKFGLVFLLLLYKQLCLTAETVIRRRK